MLYSAKIRDLPIPMKVDQCFLSIIACTATNIRRVLDWQPDILDQNTVTHLQPSILQLQLTLTTESQLLLSLFRVQDILQTQLALSGHQLTLLDSSPQLTVN
jgi:hypothetical protein